MFVKFGLPPFFLGGAASLSSAIEDKYGENELQ
jgi:hypothetical protein